MSSQLQQKRLTPEEKQFLDSGHHSDVEPRQPHRQPIRRVNNNTNNRRTPPPRRRSGSQSSSSEGQNSHQRPPVRPKMNQPKPMHTPVEPPTFQELGNLFLQRAWVDLGIAIPFHSVMPLASSASNSATANSPQCVSQRQRTESESSRVDRPRRAGCSSPSRPASIFYIRSAGYVHQFQRHRANGPSHVCRRGSSRILHDSKLARIALVRRILVAFCAHGYVKCLECISSVKSDQSTHDIYGRR